ncbi:MAG: ATP-dependent helicase [Dehalococcoidia bacterium]
MVGMASGDVFERFSRPAREWFRDTFPGPTRAQELGWAAIAEGKHTVLLAPTGSGKTLAAFLWSLDRLVTDPAPRDKRGRRAGVRVLYVSPLKALSYDIERNLRAPLAGLRIAAARAGLPVPDIAVATRTGDTPQREREAIRRDPPDILITTPESLYLMLTSRAREALRTVETVIVDEIHTMAATKRGAHLALSLERLEALTGRPFQRIGLSATQRPLDEIARYLGGDRPVEAVDAGSEPSLDLRVVVPVEDMERPGDTWAHAAVAEGAYGVEARTSIWPAIYPELLELIREHRSTLVFVNNRRLAERIALRVNELAGEELVRTHHGSMSPAQRTEVEEQLKSGALPALVCTSSMELGIDMGAVDLVVQVESPKSVARGLQRVGRAGHQVGEVSVGRIFPKFRGDLLECAVLTERMMQGAIEATSVPRNPLDVLAQQIVAMCAMDELAVDEIERLVRRTCSFADLSREQLENVLAMLAGYFPSDEFADLRPRVIWDRERDTVSSRGDAKTVAIVNGGTIPDRGLYGVYLGEDGPRVGELDEEMVYESRPGETFLLGATTWRIERITRDRVIVSPAPGEPGKMPFWRGDGIGRPYEFGRAIGAFTREVVSWPAERAVAELESRCRLDGRAAENLVAYLNEQREATGVVPSDRTVVVERFRDELGDWRVVILSPFGGQVHAPWALALEATLSERAGFEVQTIWSDDGIALRFAGTDELPSESLLFPDPEEVEELLINRLADSSLFAARFRENAARALLLPRPRPGARTPLWMQRQRAAHLLAVASRYPGFPMILETYRECLRDVFDMPGLVDLLARIRGREVRVATVETREASPFARSLVFDYIAAYMYEGDAPLAEQRAQALTLDRNLLNDLLGEDELRELLDPAALEQTELELQGLAETHRARNADQLHDLLRRVGDLSLDEVRARVADGPMAEAWLGQLGETRRACAVAISGEERWIAMEDAGRYRDALGVSPPLGVPEAFLGPTEDPLGRLVARFARTHAPFVAADVARRWRLPEAMARQALERLEAAGTVVHGAFRPGGAGREWCDVQVLRTIRRRSLARLRREVEPVDQAAYARFLLAWHGIGGEGGGIGRLREVVVQIEGLPLPVSVLERDILPARMGDYRPSMLDELGATGEVAWAGCGSLGRTDGRVALMRREQVALVRPEPPEFTPGPAHRRILQWLEARGASFFAEIVKASEVHPREALEAIWDLVWAGLITNDTFAPVRAVSGARAAMHTPRGRGSLVPADAVGRWSLVPGGDDERAAATERAHALARMLLERYGVVTREVAVAEGIPGGFAALYPVLRAMEEAGQVRRGYFVQGLGGAQFALPGAVDRLRAYRERPDEPAVVVLAATDPANPYGAALPWPREGEDDRRPFQRVAGAYVVLVDGELALFVERGGRGLHTTSTFRNERAAPRAVEALVALAPRSSRGVLNVQSVDGVPVSESQLVRHFVDAGFVAGYKGMSYREGARRMSGARRG